MRMCVLRPHPPLLKKMSNHHQLPAVRKDLPHHPILRIEAPHILRLHETHILTHQLTLSRELRPSANHLPIAPPKQPKHVAWSLLLREVYAFFSGFVSGGSAVVFASRVARCLCIRHHCCPCFQVPKADSPNALAIPQGLKPRLVPPPPRGVFWVQFINSITFRYHP